MIGQQWERDRAATRECRRPVIKRHTAYDLQAGQSQYYDIPKTRIVVGDQHALLACVFGFDDPSNFKNFHLTLQISNCFGIPQIENSPPNHFSIKIDRKNKL